MTCLMDKSLSGALIKLHTSMLGTFFVYTLAQRMPISKKKSSQIFLGESCKLCVLHKKSPCVCIVRGHISLPLLIFIQQKVVRLDSNFAIFLPKIFIRILTVYLFHKSDILSFMKNEVSSIHFHNAISLFMKSFWIIYLKKYLNPKFIPFRLFLLGASIN